MDSGNLIASIRQHITDNELPQAFDKLQALLKSSPHLDEVLHLKGRHTDLRQRVRKGTIREEEKQVEINTIRDHLFELLRVVEEKINLAANTPKPAGPRTNPGGPIPKHLTQPPLISDVFIGRDKELKAIHKILTGNENILLLVNGNGGMGKTTLASQYYHRHQKDYQHLAWLFSEQSIEGALLRLSRELGVEIETREEHERLPLVLRALSNLDGPGLLVIDNANELDDLEKH